MSSGLTEARLRSRISLRQERSDGSFVARRKSWLRCVAAFFRLRRPAAVIRSRSKNSWPGSTRSTAMALLACAPPVSSHIANKPALRPTPLALTHEGLSNFHGIRCRDLCKQRQSARYWGLDPRDLTWGLSANQADFRCCGGTAGAQSPHRPDSL